MTEALLKLSAWLSPGFPVGAFAYSHALEWAAGSGQVRDAGTAEDWIGDCLAHGAGRTDAILLAHAWRAAGDPAALDDLAELATALAPAAERLAESRDQGAAFAQVTATAWGDGACRPAPYPVAVGAAAGRAGAALDMVAPLYLQAWVANLVSAAVRLVPLGQTEGQAILAALLPAVRAVAAEAGEAPLDAIGGAAILSDIASMRHETQQTRLFRT